MGECLHNLEVGKVSLSRPSEPEDINTNFFENQLPYGKYIQNP